MLKKVNMEFEKIQKNLQKQLAKVSHVIIKLGTNTIAPHIEDSSLSFFKNLSKQIKLMQEQNKKVIVVSSGAVGLGKKQMSSSLNTNKQFSLSEKQAFASLGQSQLIDIYRNGFSSLSILPAQILVSRLDFSRQTRYRNLKQTLDQLLQWQAVPIVNENDAVATHGLKLGDNDTLSALITAMYPSALLIILTTVDGFYFNKKKIDIIEQIMPEHFEAAGKPLPGGIGGMRTKIRSAKKILFSGQLMNICSGDEPDILQQILMGKKVGTWFYRATQDRPNSKKRWLLHSEFSKGILIVDEGAKLALVNSNASLLAVGIVSFSGDFKKGDVVEVQDTEKNILGTGSISYDSNDLKEKLHNPNGQKGYIVVHRDNFLRKSDFF